MAMIDYFKGYNITVMGTSGDPRFLLVAANDRKAWQWLCDWDDPNKRCHSGHMAHIHKDTLQRMTLDALKDGLTVNAGSWKDD